MWSLAGPGSLYVRHERVEVMQWCIRSSAEQGEILRTSPRETHQGCYPPHPSGQDRLHSSLIPLLRPEPPVLVLERHASLEKSSTLLRARCHGEAYRRVVIFTSWDRATLRKVAWFTYQRRVGPVSSLAVRRRCSSIPVAAAAPTNTSTTTAMTLRPGSAVATCPEIVDLPWVVNQVHTSRTHKHR